VVIDLLIPAALREMATMKKRITTILFVGITAVLTMFALGLGSAQASTPETQRETMQLGNQLYSQGHFNEAARLYEQLLAEGVQDSAVYFNLGNAYLQEGQLGRAIVSYERARELAPRDTAVVTNLAHAQSQNIDQLDLSAISPIHMLAEASRQWLTLNEVAWLTLLLWYIFVGLVLVVRHTRQSAGFQKAARVLTLFVGLLLVGSALLLGSRAYVDEVTPTAVVVAEELPVSVAPDPGSREAFTLHDGAAVTVLDESGAWVKIGLPGSQLNGWVLGDLVQEI
jgi:hypothetical protein